MANRTACRGENATATPKSEAAQLRAELRRLRGLAGALTRAPTGTLGAAGKVADVLAEDAARPKEEVEAPREENWNL